MGLGRLNIYCVGRNYADHAKELGNAIPETPLIFLKPSSALNFPKNEVTLPQGLGRIDHEVELVLRMGTGKEIQGLAVGIDITARDVQKIAKEKGEPWTLSKGLKNFAPVGPFLEWEIFKDPIEFSLKVNGETRQVGSSRQMIFSIPTLVEFLDDKFGLQEGDLIFTGTPEGVKPFKDGDRVEAEITSHAASKLSFQIKL